jgi:cell division protein ZapA
VKQVEVTIMGHGYILGCPEGGETLLGQAVASVDKEMSNIRDSGKVKARERIAVLAALNLAYQLAEASARTPATAPPPCGPDPLETDLDGLLRRVDTALGDDGHLL